MKSYPSLSFSQPRPSSFTLWAPSWFNRESSSCCCTINPLLSMWRTPRQELVLYLGCFVKVFSGVFVAQAKNRIADVRKTTFWHRLQLSPRFLLSNMKKKHSDFMQWRGGWLVATFVLEGKDPFPKVEQQMATRGSLARSLCEMDQLTGLNDNNLVQAFKGYHIILIKAKKSNVESVFFASQKPQLGSQLFSMAGLSSIQDQQGAARNFVVALHLLWFSNVCTGVKLWFGLPELILKLNTTHRLPTVCV